MTTTTDASPQIIEPDGLLDAIIGLINDARRHVYIVSPFINTTEWNELDAAIARAIRRGVDVVLISRPWRKAKWGKKEMRDSIGGMRELGVRIHHAPDLHAKVYVNESEAIVGSFNLWRSKYPTVDLAVRLRDPRSLERCLSFARDPAQHGADATAPPQAPSHDSAGQQRCLLCRNVPHDPSASRQRSPCRGWADRLPPPLLERALDIRALAEDVFGRSIRTRCRVSYFAVKCDGLEEQLFRLVARPGHLEFRLPQPHGESIARQAVRRGFECEHNGDSVTLIVPMGGDRASLDGVRHLMSQRFTDGA